MIEPEGATSEVARMMQMLLGTSSASDEARLDPFRAAPTGSVTADIVRPALLATLVKTQRPLPTGTLLDRLCLTEDGRYGLGGLPSGCTTAFCGPPGQGKSRTALAALARCAAAGVRCALVVAEEGFVDPDHSGRDDLCSRLAKIAMALLGMDETAFRERVAPQLWVLQAQYHRGHQWSDFVARYRYLVEQERVSFVVVDSLNMLDPAKNRTADLLAALKTYNHERGVTALVIGQIRDSGDPAGGEALVHAADATLLLELITMSTKEQADQWQAKYRDRILVLRALKSITTPVFPHPLRVAQEAGTGLLVPHPAQPPELALPPAAPPR